MSSGKAAEIEMRILVIEDNEKHLADAKQFAQQLVGCVVDFATNLAEAVALLARHVYDEAICDVFFPAEAGASAETFENALMLSNLLVEKDVHHVFNTSGNHHGAKYQGFLHQTPKFRGSDGVYDNIYSAPFPLEFLGTGMVIEAYPDDSDGDQDVKQWQAAFRYVLLVHSLRGVGREECASIISGPGVLVDGREKHPELLKGFPYGEYGQLTERLAKCTHPFVVETFQRYGA